MCFSPRVNLSFVKEIECSWQIIVMKIKIKTGLDLWVAVGATLNSNLN